MYFRYYGLQKPWLDKSLKSLVSKDSSTSNSVNWPKHCSNLKDSTFTMLSYKNSLLVICKLLGLFVNTLTAKDKYSLLNRDNLMQPFQM